MTELETIAYWLDELAPDDLRFRQLNRHEAAAAIRKAEAELAALKGLIGRIRESAMVNEDIDGNGWRNEIDAMLIGKMCSEGRPPTMSIPARPDQDEDFLICATLNEAADALEQREGWVSVPREPTKAMRIAGLEQWKRVTNGIVTVKAIYRAMIAAGEGGNG